MDFKTPKNPKPLDRAEYLARAVIKPVTLVDGSLVNIKALPASFIVDGASGTVDVTDHFGAANLLVQSLVDENGDRLFENNEKAMAMAIDNASLRILIDAVMELNGMTQATGSEASDIEKN